MKPSPDALVFDALHQEGVRGIVRNDDQLARLLEFADPKTSNAALAQRLENVFAAVAAEVLDGTNARIHDVEDLAATFRAAMTVDQLVAMASQAIDTIEVQ